MQLQPIVYVTDMARSIKWYSTVLADEPAMASGHWTTFLVGGAILALHHTVDTTVEAGAVELSLVADEPLEMIAGRVPGSLPIRTQPFGRSFTVTDPDGTRIQINEHA